MHKTSTFYFGFVLDLQGHDISCQLNTDGVRLFKSAENNVWPIYLSINEMPYKKRRRNTALCGIWYGSHKPNLTTFLRPFVSKCNVLQHEPIQWKHEGQLYTSRVFFPLFTADSVARPMVQGFKQHNGYYGCPWCLCPGERPKVQ